MFQFINLPKKKKSSKVWKYTNLDLGALIYVGCMKLVMSCHYKSPDPYADCDGREQQIEIEHFFEYYFLAMYQTIRHEIWIIFLFFFFLLQSFFFSVKLIQIFHIFFLPINLSRTVYIFVSFHSVSITITVPISITSSNSWVTVLWWFIIVNIGVSIPIFNVVS